MAKVTTDKMEMEDVKNVASPGRHRDLRTTGPAGLRPAGIENH